MAGRRRRPLWQSLTDGIGLIALLLLVIIALDRWSLVDLGTGNARAKDGDSLVLNGTEIRLHGIDAPELNQSCSGPTGEYACGRMARDALRTLLRGRMINCKSLENDRYGRAVSTCKDGALDINAEMVRQGWAVAYFRHSTAYARMQKEAKAARRGIWQGRFDMPETYRARMRPIESSAGGGSSEVD